MAGTGVVKHKCSYRAVFTHNGKRIHVGMFTTQKKARIAFLEKRIEMLNKDIEAITKELQELTEQI